MPNVCQCPNGYSGTNCAGQFVIIQWPSIIVVISNTVCLQSKS